jgi:hypothetical protein
MQVLLCASKMQRQVSVVTPLIDFRVGPSSTVAKTPWSGKPNDGSGAWSIARFGTERRSGVLNGISAIYPSKVLEAYMTNIKIAIVNESTVLSDADVKKALPDLQTQIHRDFAPAWGIDADLLLIDPAKKIPDGVWVVGIFDTSDQANALGYHDVTSEDCRSEKSSRNPISTHISVGQSPRATSCWRCLPIPTSISRCSR